MEKPDGIVLERLPSAFSLQRTFMAYVDLTKPRIMMLLLYTGLCGMIVGLHHFPSISLLVATMVGLALSTGGSAALNMWYDRDIDRLMKRTRNRPIPAGLVKAETALVFGIVLIAISFVELYLLVNPLTAVLSLAGAFYYVVVYTFWLKRRTPQNIVIGGGAGAFPPLIGAAAVTGQVGLSAILLFLIVFLWTPPHFWSLAVYKNDEYRRANVPMMPVIRGAKSTKIQSLVYGVLLFLSTIALVPTIGGHWLYIPVAVVLNVVFIYYLTKSVREEEGQFDFAKKSFMFSIMYLFVLFLVAAVASLI